MFLPSLETLCLLVVTFLTAIKCECRQSYTTMCEDFEEFTRYKDVDNLKTLVIGSEYGDVNQASVNLMVDLAYDKYHKLTTLSIVRAINQLRLVRSVRCTYVESPLKYFTLYGNNFKIIQKNNFPVLPLKVLSLVNNKIESVKSLSFDSHPIEDIDLSDNLLEVIERKALPSTSVTKVITVKNNRLSHIEEDSFPSSLESLNLDGNNLRYIQTKVFEPLVNLKELTMSHNNFIELPPIKHMKQLIIFDISFNFVASVEDGTFKDMSNLKLIDLSNNYIVQPGILKAVNTPGRQLSVTISLALNRLRDLNFEGVTLQGREYVLYGNPWDCTKWPSIKKNLLTHESKCDYESLTGADRPYCVGSGQDLSTLEEDINKFQTVIKNGRKNFWCLWEMRRNRWLHPINVNCIR